MSAHQISQKALNATIPLVSMASAAVLTMALAEPIMAASNAAKPPSTALSTPYTAQNGYAANKYAVTPPSQGTNPCAATNPGIAKAYPCTAQEVKRPANYKPYQGNESELVTLGSKLFKDKLLSSNGLSCDTCHQGLNMFQPSFSRPYPHEVIMSKNQFGMSQVFLDEMIQVCMVAPMAAAPLEWESKELAALVAYIETLQRQFKPNPPAAKSP